MNLWKACGLAGLAGVAAAGVIIAREQRQRSQLAPEEIRARLHERLQQAPTASTLAPVVDASPTSMTWLRWLRRRRRGRADP